MNQEKLTMFLLTYRAEFLESVTLFPSAYALGSDEGPAAYVNRVYPRMADAITRGSFSKDSRSFKNTCKRLGIPHTYKAIAAYLTPKE